MPREVRGAPGGAAVERTAAVGFDSGLHVRAASAFARAARRYRAAITVRAGDATADGKSVVELLTLAAARGSRLRIVAEGPDAACAADELAGLLAAGFEEDVP
ncbi:MAG: HPr family phosphocarrier protein [Deltaproteobacteria bacterium]|nr:HPr family phosphocarrier protein [Deltaproteobacteria bacterium]